MVRLPFSKLILMSNSQNVVVDGGAGASLIVKQQFSRDGRQYLKDSAVRRRGQTIKVFRSENQVPERLRLRHIKTKVALRDRSQNAVFCHNTIVWDVF